MSGAMAAGAAFGAVTSYMATKEKNKALAAQARFNIQKYNNQKSMTLFAQSNNQQRANEISEQIAQESADVAGKISVEERKAIGTETIRRGEGLTAGASVQRSVDDVMKRGAEAKAKVKSQEEQAYVNVQSQARQANAQAQVGLINAYNDLLINNAQLAASQVTGLNALLQIGSGALQGASAGQSVGNSLDAGATYYTDPTTK